MPVWMARLGSRDCLTAFLPIMSAARERSDLTLGRLLPSWFSGLAARAMHKDLAPTKCDPMDCN